MRDSLAWNFLVVSLANWGETVHVSKAMDVADSIAKEVGDVSKGVVYKLQSNRLDRESGLS